MTMLKITESSFNPLPAIKPGDTVVPMAGVIDQKRFNPLPAIKPGDTAGGSVFDGVAIVSIHSRLLSREIRSYQCF